MSAREGEERRRLAHAAQHARGTVIPPAAGSAVGPLAVGLATPSRPAVSGPLLGGPRPAWAALYWNVLAFLGSTPLLPIPTPLGQLIAQVMLPLAVVLALLANPGVVIRPNVVLFLISLMALEALLAGFHGDFPVGSTYRAVRLLLFVVVLWLLTPWWGRQDLPLLYAHLFCQRVILASVLVGAAVAWGSAHSIDGRLRGALWPIPPPQVAHYAAVLLGCTTVLWFCGALKQRTMILTLLATAFALIDSHTRTALAGLVVGLLVAGASLFVGHARVRRTTAVVAVLAAFLGAVFSPFLSAWLSRGQTAEDTRQLTGRTKVWTAALEEPRTWIEEAFGRGLTNKSFNGLPVDSNWVATYLDQGLFGVGLVIAFLLTLGLTVLTRPRGPRRAVALFLLAYCVVASFTETGLGDASPYLLEVVVAASVLAAPPASRASGGPNRAPPRIFRRRSIAAGPVRSPSRDTPPVHEEASQPETGRPGGADREAAAGEWHDRG